MTEKQIAESAFRLWKLRDIGGDKNNVTALLEDMVQATVDKIVARSTEFTFAIDTGTKSFTTGDSNMVELFGNNSDARVIYTVLWGSKNRLLRKYGEFETDASFSGTTITGDQFGWVNRGNGANGYPKIEILGDAVATGDSITYRYLRNDITIQEFPTQWEFVVRDVLLSDARPTAFAFLGRKSLQQMLDFYETPRKGGEVSLPDENIANENLRRFTELNVG